MSTATTAATTKPAKRQRTSRRGNGEGTIYQRPDGRWVATASIGRREVRNKAGVMVRRLLRKTVYGWTKREAQEKLLKIQNAKIDGTLPNPDTQTIATYLDRWVQDCPRLQVRATTLSRYKTLIELHIKPYIGGVQLAKLTPSHVQAMQSSLEAAGKSARLRQQVHNVLSPALKQAVKWRYVPRNVCEVIDAPRVKTKKITPLTKEQSLAFIQAASGHRLKALFILAITTGMRQGEMFAIQWENIDLKAGTLNVCHTLLDLKGGHELGETKTASSRRCVTLSDIAVEALTDHRKRMLAEGHAGSKWVFCDRKGGHLRKSNLIRQQFKPLLKSAGLPEIRFHDLRHTAATLAIAGGVNIKVVQEMLGHSSIRQTLDTYSHVLPSMQSEAAKAMDNIFRVTPDAIAATA